MMMMMIIIGTNGRAKCIVPHVVVVGRALFSMYLLVVGFQLLIQEKVSPRKASPPII